MKNNPAKDLSEWLEVRPITKDGIVKLGVCRVRCATNCNLRHPLESKTAVMTLQACLKKIMQRDPPSDGAGPTPEQFAQMIQWHPESVRRAIRAGRIHAVLFGRGYRIPNTEVSRILADGLPS